MTAATPAAAARDVAGRFDFRFSGSGRWGVSTLARGETLMLEHWALDKQEPRCRLLADVAVNRRTRALPLDDGRVLLQRGPAAAAGSYELVLLEPTAGGCEQWRLGTIEASLGAYLLPGPTAAQVGFVVTLDDPGRCVIRRIAESPPGVEPLMEMPGTLSGGVWLDGDRGLLAANLTSEAGLSCGVAIDIPGRTYRRIWSVSDASTDRIAAYRARSDLLVATTNASGEQRIGYALLGQGVVRFPDSLHRPGYPRTPLGLDERGERLLVHERQGATSRLYIYTPADDRLRPLPAPPGAVSAPSSWKGDLIRFRFSSPDQPPTLATVQLRQDLAGSERPAEGGARMRPAPATWSRRSDLAPAGRLAPAKLVDLPGPTGPIETVVYGGDEWRRCARLVVALHGGPLSSWAFGYEPLLQSLAQAGIATAAPNYRGSTGYGHRHLTPVLGDWGGPDVDDVLQLARDLRAERAPLGLSPPVVVGASYGAFLALLAASHEPDLWSGCVALAPFLSGPRLHEDAGAVVRERVAALGGLDRANDPVRPRDVLRACGSLSVPTLLAHGTRDETIPVNHSRTLRCRLIELGNLEGEDFRYVEVDSEHDGVAQAQRSVLRERVVRFCLARGGPRSHRRPAPPGHEAAFEGDLEADETLAVRSEGERTQE